MPSALTITDIGVAAAQQNIGAGTAEAVDPTETRAALTGTNDDPGLQRTGRHGIELVAA